MDGTHFFAQLAAGITGCVLRPFGLCLVSMLIMLKIGLRGFCLLQTGYIFIYDYDT